MAIALRNRSRLAAGVPSLLFLTGCSIDGAPSIELFGAYFPAWLIAALVGVFAAILARVGLAMSGLDEVVPWLLAVCSSIGLIVAIAVSAIMFG